jgi:hypothetical protein
MGTQPSNTQNLAQQNALATKAVTSVAQAMSTQIFSQTYATPSSQASILVTPRNVGLTTRFYIEINGSIKNNDANTVSLSQFGLSNILSNITYTDYGNTQRINTTGWHLTFLQSLRFRRPIAGCFGLATDQMFGAAENFPVLTAPSTIASGATQAFRAVFEVPLAYDPDNDLRGAVYSNVINATSQLSLTLNNTNLGATTGTDTTNSVYTGAVSGANVVLLNTTVTVYQDYYDQLPTLSNGVPNLPLQSLGVMYELKTSPFSAITAGTNFPIPYGNGRDFLSTIAVYYNGTARATGSDINYWSLQTANSTNIRQDDPYRVARIAREILQVDLPAGVYYFPTRRKPINTLQFGNVQLNLNASTAGSTAYCLIGWEDFQNITTIGQIGSLAGN